MLAKILTACKAVTRRPLGFGVGIGLTQAGNRLIYKSRLEYSFGRRQISSD